jgi:membrane-bound serine protease (ClpP class)
MGLLIFCSLVVSGASRAQQNTVYTVKVEGTIDAGVSNFITRAIDQAERDNAPLIIQLNTPGGILKPTEEIVQRMMNSKVTVIVWVTPTGAWGFSAGTFILIASNVAVMDNATSIGAAQPRPEDPKTTAAMSEWMASVASYRGRPSDMARRFVTESLTLGPEEAIAYGVVNMRASSMDEILENIGKSGASVVEINMGTLDKVLSVLSNPDVAVGLFILGVFCLLYEVVTPGIGISGVSGVIFILLSLVGFGTFQINYVGVALVILGVGALVVEAFVHAFGVLGVSGGISLITGLGLVGIYNEPWIARVSSDLVKVVVVILLIIFAIFVVLVRRSLRRPSLFGKEAIKGKTGIAVTDIAPKGMVKIKGVLWTVTSEHKIKKGEQVIVKDAKGITLVVQRHKVRKKK